MATTQLNAAQLNVISLMSSIDTEQEQQKLQNILLEFYRNKLDSLLLQFQQDNNITQTITSDRVFSVEALTGADVEPVALNMHFGLRNFPAAHLR